MKDAKGHGSDSRGAISDADAAKALAGGGAKSEPVPVHPGAPSERRNGSHRRTGWPRLRSG